MVFEQERRLLRQLCFNCGEKKCWATSCTKPLEGVPYTCPHCDGKVIITSRGQSHAAGLQGSASLTSAAAPPQASDAAPAPKKSAPKAKVAPAASVAPARANLAALKRPAAPEMPFATCWEGARMKKRRVGQEDIRSLKDVVAKMTSGAARRALPTIGERVAVWAGRYHWKKPRDYEEHVKEFGNPSGGGRPGVGVTEKAAEAVFNELNKA
eukprot:12431497-Karenia_brevis.AAC.1